MSRPRSSISIRSLEESSPKTTFRRDFNASRASPSFCVCFHAAPVSTAFQARFHLVLQFQTYRRSLPKAADGGRSVCEPKPDSKAASGGIGRLGRKIKISPPGAPADPSKSGRSSVAEHSRFRRSKPNPTPACSKADWIRIRVETIVQLSSTGPLALPGRGSSRNCNRCCPKKPCLAGFWV